MTTEFTMIGSAPSFRKFGIKNFDKMFAENPNAIIANHISFSEMNFSEAITKLVYTDNKTGDIGFMAECDCGFLKGNYHEGSKCPYCNGIVKTGFVHNLQHKVWISIPEEIKAVPHPTFYFILSSWLSKGSKKEKGYYLNVILNPDEEYPEDMVGHFTGHGFNYFYENINYILDFFFHVHPKTSKKKEVPYIKMFIDLYKDRLFCTKLPILSNELHPISRSGPTLKYTDNSSKNILEAIIDLANIEFAKQSTHVNPVRIEKTVLKAYNSYINYLDTLIDSKLAQKYGHIRHHIFGSRFHGTYRTVIVPIMGEHIGDEIHVPWKIIVNTYLLMIINKLVFKYGASMEAAYARCVKALNRYDHQIDLILQELLRECPYKGFPTLMNRNPSLKHGAIQLLFMTKYKPMLTIAPADDSLVSIDDNTIAISPMILKAPNCDFDGDEVNCIALYEMDEVPKFQTLHPSNRMLSTHNPNVDTDITISKQHVIMLNNWLKY